MNCIEDILKTELSRRALFKLSCVLLIESLLLELAESKEKQKINYKKIPVPELGYSEIREEKDYVGIGLADKDLTIGRLQRALRWKPITDAVEQRYRIKDGILLAMIMQESYGDPIQPNMKSDGGLGLMHMQPVVASEYGLKVYGNKKDKKILKSRKYGLKLRDELLIPCKLDMRCIHKEDERVHPIKNIDAGARIVMTGYQIHKNWPHAVQFYYAPRFVGKKLGWRYWANVNKWLSALNNKKLINETEEDFKIRNKNFFIDGKTKVTFARYINDFKRICENYGLQEYKRVYL